MNATIDVDDQTYALLDFAARMSNSTPGEVVARMVATTSAPRTPNAAQTERREEGDELVVYADYEGHRTHAKYDPRTHRIDITSGPLAGGSFKTPTGAARAVVAHYKPTVSANRNGWSFWTLDDGSGKFLQSIRHSQ